ncbi:DUF674 domain-containing protein [Cinnamomum micranthum f. kanehirae]|uniref:DUF674 domain-containing protein n=1 Tax=Cinnamomum micranthum f. kanehirae TaxID=337451 RepID=A0A3S3N3Y8_9MAGN|nr:DUF674 domain-containing protein [Cinnamomum micranthum f. kanehirae]
MADKLSLKLLIDKTGKRLLSQKLEKISFDLLSVSCIATWGLVTPSLSSCSRSQPPPLLLLYSDDTDAKTEATTKWFYYTCGNYGNHSYSDGVRPQYVSDVKGTTCPSCKRAMESKAEYVSPATTSSSSASDGDGKSSEGRGFVRGVVTYMVMDDLEVMPMSTISSIALLTKFNVRDVGALEEKVVKVGVEEVVSLLKASLQSKTALTDVFLK